MGKYDELIADLPRKVSPYHERIEQLKVDFSKLNTVALAATYTGLRRDKDDLEAQMRSLNERLEAVTQLLVASQDRGDEEWGKYGVKDNALRLENGDTIRVKAEPYGQVTDKEAFRLWCIANGYEKQLQLWPSTMNTIAKERRMAGDADPDGVEIFRRETLVFVPKGKEESE